MNASAPGAIHLAAVDWAIVSMYLLGVLAVGAVVGRRARTTEAYMLASRRTPFWAAGLSLLATSLSVATFIGAPQASYDGDLTYLSLTLGSVLAAIIVAAIFIPAFYRQGVTTVYELLEDRFGPGARLAASAMFLVGRLFASGARLYIAAIPIALILFDDMAPKHLTAAIIVIASVAILYTMMGGVGAVIWTDVAQIVILLGVVIGAILLLFHQLDTPVGSMIDTLRAARSADGAAKLTIIDTSFDLSRPFTLWTALIGVTLLNVAAIGTDQDLAQRLLTCRSPRRSAAAVLFSSVLGAGVVALFLVIGLLLWLRDAGSTPAQASGDGRGTEAFVRFLLTQTPPGVRGLVVAGIAAAAMSSLDSALGAMASASVWDFYRRVAPGRSDRRYVAMSRLAVVVWGALLALFAGACISWRERSGEGLLEFALGVMVLAYGGLLGVFLTALLTRRGNCATSIAALGAGFLTAMILQSHGWIGLPFDWSLGWRMTAATAVSFVVCAAGGSEKRPQDKGASS